MSDSVLPRRALLGGLSAAGLAGLGAAALYRAAPTFWKQYASEFKRGVLNPPLIPDLSKWNGSGLHAAWLGHTTVLLKIDGFTILTDPVFSERVGLNLGIATLGPKRLVAPALDIPKLPHIDAVLLSHAHMDHMDLPSLRALENRRTSVVTARGTSDLLRVPNYREVRELGWEEKTRLGPVTFRAFRVNHWGARMRSDTWRGYNGYLIEAGRYRILFAGDTADMPFGHLKSSRPYQLAIMPIGAYNPWIRYHTNPEQAWRMGEEAGAESMLPVHHQTFTLSREPAWEPIQRFYEAAGKDSDRVALAQIGAECRLG